MSNFPSDPAHGLFDQVQPLVKEAAAGGQPEQIRPKVLKVRKQYESKIAALLTDAQKKQWQEMLGKPFDPGDGRRQIQGIEDGADSWPDVDGTAILDVIAYSVLSTTRGTIRSQPLQFNRNVCYHKQSRWRPLTRSQWWLSFAAR